jgi:hypothetical protein
MTTAGRRTPPLSDEDVRATPAIRKGSDTVEFRALHSAAFADWSSTRGRTRPCFLRQLSQQFGTAGSGTDADQLRNHGVQVESVSQDDASE